jgi:hypothetical protein
MDNRVALVAWEFFICLLKRLRYDVFDVWLHEGLKLMKRVTECSGHNRDCSLALPPPEPIALRRWPLGYHSPASGKAAVAYLVANRRASIARKQP